VKYTISIADDEPRVRKGLASLIRSRGGDWEVGGLFADGNTALAGARAQPSDLILADIRMPGLDGLALAGALRADCPNTVVVVMSGYKEFDYARRAMKEGVLDFIVKPIEEDELFGVLERARAEIERRGARGKQAVLARDADAIKDALFAEVLTSGSLDETERRFYEFLDLQPAESVVLSVLLLPANGVTSASPPSRSEIERALPRVESVTANVLLFQDLPVILVSRDAAAQTGPPMASVLRYAQDIAAGLSQQFSPRVRVGLSRPHSGRARLRTAFEESVAAMQPGYYEHGESIFSFVPMNGAAVPFPTAALDKLMACLVTGDRAATSACARDFLRSYGRAQVPLALLEDHVGAGAKRIQEALSPILPDSAEVRTLAQSLTPVLRHGWFETLQEEFVRAMVSLCAEVEHANQKRLSRAVRRAVRYIEDNYGRDLPLEEVATSAGLSPSYFSSSFKRETGRNVVEYITEYRVERAIEMLCATNLNTSEVAYRVGFNDPKYFARIFKRSVGVSPSLYRKYSLEK
jgi:two-component system response regulator YesN